MKTRLSLLCIALTLLIINVADAQHGRLHNRLQGGLRGGGGSTLDSGFQHVSGDLLQTGQRSGGRAGRLWFEANLAEDGLGFQGPYFTVGGKTRLFEDRLDGRWLFEGQFHHSIDENGGPFANIGISRVFSIDSAGADVSMGVWYDYDGDRQATFSHTFHQVGVSGSIKTRRWDLIGNGYIPTGVQDFILGDPTGQNNFFGNNIVITPGIDSGLQGFDVTLRMRPKALAFANGTVDVGGYHYNSDLVNAFGGGRVRMGFQVLGGMIVNLEVNHDDRFDTTGVLGLGWIFGSNAGGAGNEYSGIGRDLEQTVRNDHIVRFNQDVVLAIDPETGLAYNVVHVNNTANGVIGVGSAELPFSTLLQAEQQSVEGDIIYVAAGDGTDRLYRDGITLKDDQFLISGGSGQLIPLAGGGFFQPNGVPGGAATISNSGGDFVVRLASNNVVGGINIDATGATYGILAEGQAVRGGEVRDTNVSGANLSGIHLLAVTGDWNFLRNTSTGNGVDGLFVNGGLDPTSNWNFEDNFFDNNGFDGLHLQNYDGQTLTIRSNQTSNNGRHGLFLNRNIDVDGPGGIAGATIGSGIQVNILGHMANNNGGQGIFINEGNGDLMIVNSSANNNSASGLRIRNWTNTLGNDRTQIGTTTGGVSQFMGNGTGISLELNGIGLVQDILLTDLQVDNNGRGLAASSQGDGTILNLDIIDNISFSNNESDGIRLLVDNSGTINNTIMNNDGLLNLAGNNINSGATLTYVLNGPGGVAPSVINSVLRNVNINTVAGTGISVQEVGNSRINLDVADSTITAATGVAISVDNNNNNEINRTVFDNVTLRANVGITGASQAGTLWDFSLTNSDVQSNGLLPLPGEVLNPAAPVGFTPFTDAQGTFGLVLSADGGGAPPGALFDNLTRINLVNNVIRDFTFEGIQIMSTGDAQILANIEANSILNNGPGLNDDPANDGTFTGATTMVPDPVNLFFHDGVEIIASDISTITATINNNAFLNNFQRGLTLQTIGSGTINSVLGNNRFSNDIGFDTMNQFMNTPFDGRITDMNVINAANGNICVGFTNNTFALNVAFLQAPPLQLPRSLQVGLDGASNGFSNAALPLTVGVVGVGLCENLITAEELFFVNSGGFEPSPE